MPYYVLTLASVIDGDEDNPSINVFTYLTTEVTPSVEGAGLLRDAFFDLFLDTGTNLLLTVHANTTFKSLTITAPQNPELLFISLLDSDGEATGDPAPRFVAFEFQSPRTIGTVKAGNKRFGAVSEGMLTGGVLNPTFETLMDDLADDLSTAFEIFVDGLTTFMTPIIVKRIPYTAPSGRRAYRLPGGLDPFVYSIATNWGFKRVTTQNSRKR